MNLIKMIYFSIVKEYKYLENIITFNLYDESDVKLKLNYFYLSFNSLYRSFTGSIGVLHIEDSSLN